MTVITIERRSDRGIIVKGLTAETVQTFALDMAKAFALWVIGLEAGSEISPYRWGGFGWDTWEDDIADLKAPHECVAKVQTKQEVLHREMTEAEWSFCQSVQRGEVIPEDSTLNPCRLTWNPEVGQLFIYDTASGSPWGEEHQARWFPAEYRHMLKTAA